MGEKAETVMIVGHNPGLEELVAQFFDRTLTKEDGQAADSKRVTVAAQPAKLNAGLVQTDLITMCDVRVHVFGDAAIVPMEAESKATYKGRPIS